MEIMIYLSSGALLFAPSAAACGSVPQRENRLLQAFALD
jgi:hypothetical protein